MSKRNQAIAGLILVPLLLSGCGSKSDTGGTAANANTAPAAVQSSTGSAPQALNAAQTPAAAQTGKTPMNENEMRMRMLFQSLTAVDKTDGLAFTKQQAEQMLPLAEAAVTKKELTAEQQDSLLKLLTPEQTKQYQANADRMKQRTDAAAANGAKGQPPKQMTQEERDKMKEQRQQQGQAQGQTQGQGQANGQASGSDTAQAKTDGQKPAANGNGGKARGAGGGANTGQQFVDLLKERAK